MPRLTAAKRKELQAKFKKYDNTGDGKLDFTEMKNLLREGNPDLDEKALRSLYQKVDKDNSGSVDFDEFVNYLYQVPQTYACAPQACNDKFTEFAGPEMDGKEFAKFCKDCGLIDKGFKTEDIDVTFAKVLPRGKRKITLEVGKEGYSQYDKLLSLLAEKKKVTPAEVFEIVAGGEKSSSGTKADAVRFHDDKTLYTGSHGANEAHGRAEAEAAAPKVEREAFDIGPEGDWTGCKKTFEAFDTDSGNGEGLGCREFTKLCEDAGLTDKNYHRGKCDLVFTELRKKKLVFEDFQQALRLIAEDKKEQIQDVQNQVARCSGPQFENTTADSVRFHDDKDTYTGMHAGK